MQRWTGRFSVLLGAAGPAGRTPRLLQLRAYSAACSDLPPTLPSTLLPAFYPALPPSLQFLQLPSICNPPKKYGPPQSQSLSYNIHSPVDILAINCSCTPLHLRIFSFPLSYSPLKKWVLDSYSP